MHHRILRHVRSNAVAYVALFVAMGGTSVAAVSLANHSINPVKFNPRYVGGYVRAWVSVSAQGKLLASGGGSQVTRAAGGGPGAYIINWRPQPTSRCTATGSVDIERGTQGTPGYVVAETVGGGRQAEQSALTVYDGQGQAAWLPFDVELICGTPR